VEKLCTPNQKEQKQNKIVILVEIEPYFKNHMKLKFMLANLTLFGNLGGGGHVVAWWLRHYATNRKVAGLIPNEVNF
jgi:hypothetical protein